MVQFVYYYRKEENAMNKSNVDILEQNINSDFYGLNMPFFRTE